MIDIEKCKLTRYPAQILKLKAKPVEEINEDIRLLVERMIDIMVESNGIGLAAPQANMSLRLFVISLKSQKEDAMVFINPRIETAGATETMEEGCLSVPGIYTNIKRPAKVTVTAQDLDGKEFTLETTELLSKCIQHEYDHLEGKTIVDRMSMVAKIKYRRTLETMNEGSLL